MAHQPLHINDWIEIDKEYRWYLDEKARVIKEQGERGTASAGCVSYVECCTNCRALQARL